MHEGGPKNALYYPTEYVRTDAPTQDVRGEKGTARWKYVRICRTCSLGDVIGVLARQKAHGVPGGGLRIIYGDPGVSLGAPIAGQVRVEAGAGVVGKGAPHHLRQAPRQVLAALHSAAGGDRWIETLRPLQPRGLTFFFFFFPVFPFFLVMTNHGKNHTHRGSLDAACPDISNSCRG